jgi:hypothetical protein
LAVLLPFNKIMLETTYVESQAATMEEPTLLDMIGEEIQKPKNGNVNKETILLRTFKMLTETRFNLSWNVMMETVKSGSCLLDSTLHDLIDSVIKQNTIADDAKIDRVLSKDYVKATDMSYLASIFNKCLCKDAFKLFAVDGYQGKDDLKRYVDNFKWEKEEYKRLHVQGVRALYDKVSGDVHATLTAIFQVCMDEYNGVEPSMEVDLDLYETYFNIVGSKNWVIKIGEWRLSEYKKYTDEIKRKMENEKNNPKKKKVKTEVMPVESDEESEIGVLK